MHKSFSNCFFQNKVQLIRGGKDYFEKVINLINEAKETIHLQTYIFESDETGIMVANALIAAAKRNIDIYLLIDGYGSKNLSKEVIKKIESAGINFRFFEPLFKSYNLYFGRRLHHKLLIIDSRFALVGGINVSNKYNDINKNAAWLDFTLYIEGEIAKEICVLCWKTWNGFSKIMAKTPCENNIPVFNFIKEEISTICMRRNDWVRRKNEISETYIQMLLNAKNSITILCSYFLPGKLIRKHISKASKRGITINIITTGKSDVMIAKHAERWLYDYLLRNNINIYEYQSTVLHAKMAICDREWLTIGSYNINDLSAYASIELNLNVYDKEFASRSENYLNKIIKDECIKITIEKHIKKKKIYTQIIRWISYEIIRFVFIASTFYYKKIRNDTIDDQYHSYK